MVIVPKRRKRHTFTHQPPLLAVTHTRRRLTLDQVRGRLDLSETISRYELTIPSFLGGLRGQLAELGRGLAEGWAWARIGWTFSQAAAGGLR